MLWVLLVTVGGGFTGYLLAAENQPMARDLVAANHQGLQRLDYVLGGAGVGLLIGVVVLVVFFMLQSKEQRAPAQAD